MSRAISDQAVVVEALARAEGLVTRMRYEEAEGLLMKAEADARSSGSEGILSMAILSLARLHLCMSQPSLALQDLSRMDVADVLPGGETGRRYLFLQGLAFLLLGREEVAHSTLNRFISLSDEAGDEHSQALGHYYLGLTYERHGEPCMASAELEMGRDVTDPSSDILFARYNAFLAHLWLRRLAVEEARSEMEEALRRTGSITIDSEPSSIGVVNLVDAEFHAARSDWDASREKFDLSVRILHVSRMGGYLEAVAYSWYGEMLIILGKGPEGAVLLERAAALFEALGNSSQVSRARAKIAEVQGGDK